MPIANCKRCGRIFNRTRRDICISCIAEEDQAFLVVRAYLHDHRDANLQQLSDDTGISASLIVHMIQDGRLILRDNPNLTYPCQRCGDPTQSGRYCSDCAAELSRDIGNARNDLRAKINSERDPKRGYFSKQ